MTNKDLKPTKDISNETREQIDDEISVPASTSPVHEHSDKDIRLSYGAYIELGKKIERSARDIDLKREIGLYKTYHLGDEER